VSTSITIHNVKKLNAHSLSSEAGGLHWLTLETCGDNYSDQSSITLLISDRVLCERLADCITEICAHRKAEIEAAASQSEAA